MAWDALYEAQPTDATYVADTDDAIRSLKTDIRTRVAVEHGFNLSESSPQAGHGKHLRGSARIFVQSTDPTATSVTADDADYATGRVWLDSDDGRLKIYRGGTWNSSIAVSYADNAGSSVNATNAANSDTVDGVHIKIVDIGDWNMDTAGFKNIVHGLTLSKIRGARAIVRDDAGTFFYPIERIGTGGLPAGDIGIITSTDLRVERVGGSSFDTASFSATSYNRGWVIIEYVN